MFSVAHRHKQQAPNLSGLGFESRVEHAETARRTVARNGAKVASVNDILSF